MTELSPKRRAFAAEYVRDHSATAAAIRAGFAERSARSQGSQLLAMPCVKAEVERLERLAADALKFELEDAFKILLEAVDIGRRKESASSMTNTVIAIAKLKGWWVEKTEDLAVRAQNEAERQRAFLERDANALAEAAESMDLARTATVEEIAKANAARANPTPAVFKLLHIAAKTKSETIQ